MKYYIDKDKVIWRNDGKWISFLFIPPNAHYYRKKEWRKMFYYRENISLLISDATELTEDEYFIELI